jgi:IclR family acetate operon transcriptional repressor
VRRSGAILDSPSAKVIAVLDAVASRGVASMATIASDLSIPTPTIHRIATELERLGYLQREPGSRQLTVSGPLVTLASNVMFAASGRVVIKAILRRLSESIGEMCSLAVQVGDEVVYIASAEPPQDLMLSFRAGRKAPLYCTSSGRLFLARLSDDELRAYLKGSRRKAYTSYTRTEAQRIMADVRKVRGQGFAVSNQEYIQHIVGAAVPVVTEENKLIAALSVAALSVRVSLDRLRQLVPELQKAAVELASSISETGPTERLPARAGSRRKRPHHSKQGVRS